MGRYERENGENLDNMVAGGCPGFQKGRSSLVWVDPEGGGGGCLGACRTHLHYFFFICSALSNKFSFAIKKSVCNYCNKYVIKGSFRFKSY